MKVMLKKKLIFTVNIIVLGILGFEPRTCGLKVQYSTYWVICPKVQLKITKQQIIIEKQSLK